MTPTPPPVSHDAHDAYECQQRVARAYESGHNDGKASAELTERVTAEIQAQERAACYERGHDDALDVAVELARRVLDAQPGLLHTLEQALIGRYSPAGLRESAVPELPWAQGPHTG